MCGKPFDEPLEFAPLLYGKNPTVRAYPNQFLRAANIRSYDRNAVRERFEHDRRRIIITKRWNNDDIRFAQLKLHVRMCPPAQKRYPRVFLCLLSQLQ